MSMFDLENRSVLKTMIVDDEASERTRLMQMLSRIEGVSVVAQARSAREAITKMQSVDVDVVFLDVNMPDATGIVLARALQTLRRPPAIVFASAHSEYAHEAFDVHAVDYLVKPVRAERLVEAVERVKEHTELHALARKPNRILVESGNKKVFIPVKDIRFAEAHDDNAYVQTGTNRYFVISNLGKLEKSLDGHGFFRVHRSFLVNLEQVEEIEPRAGGALSLTLNGVCGKVPVSRRRASQVRRALGA